MYTEYTYDDYLRSKGCQSEAVQAISRVSEGLTYCPCCETYQEAWRFEGSEICLNCWNSVAEQLDESRLQEKLSRIVQKEATY